MDALVCACTVGRKAGSPMDSFGTSETSGTLCHPAQDDDEDDDHGEPAGDREGRAPRDDDAALHVRTMPSSTVSSSNAAAMRARVYGSRGWSRICAADPSSTTRPACMTITSSASARITFRSWLMNM